MDGWRRDILGDGFEARDLDLGSDTEGPVFATLVRSLPPPPARSAWWRPWARPSPRPLEDVDVLYVHGWSDYFFQRRLARFWTERGARFHALDLRKYGRSLREWQTPGYVEDLDEYDAEIGLAREIIRAGLDGDAASRRLVLLGHSTGGLILSLWCDRHPGEAAALVLNSPWLEFQFSARIRQALLPFVDLHARINPHDEAVPQLDFGYYALAQQQVADPSDPMEVNESWRPSRSMPVRAGWLRAVMNGHGRVAEGLTIGTPVCVLLSARSEYPLRWSETLTRVDSVLDVEEVARAALRLGSSVAIERIDGALHDVFLSRAEPREDAYARLDRWVTGWAASSPAPPAG